MTGHLHDVAYGGGSFVAVGSSKPHSMYSGKVLPGVNSSGAILTSPDGIAWTIRGTDYGLTSVDFNGSQFVAVGRSGAILISPLDPLAVRPRAISRPFSFRVTSSHLFADFSGSEAMPVHTAVYTSTGARVMEAVGQGGEVTLSIGGLPRGVYTLEAGGGHQRVSRVFVKH